MNPHESFLQEKNIDAEIFKQLSDEIDKKFAVESLIGIANKDNIEELYFCIVLPTEVSQQKTVARINDTLNFPLEYDQLEDGRRTKFIAVKLDELRELINQIDNQNQTKQLTIKPTDEKVSDVKNHIERDISAAVPGDAPLKVKREEWEKQMLKLEESEFKRKSRECW